MHEEKVNCLWTILTQVFKSPKGHAALSLFEPKDFAVPDVAPADIVSVPDVAV